MQSIRYLLRIYLKILNVLEKLLRPSIEKQFLAKVVMSQSHRLESLWKNCCDNHILLSD